MQICRCLCVHTVSGSLCCSMKAENSTKQSLCVAIALPSHPDPGGTEITSEGPFPPPAGWALAPGGPPYIVCANGLTLRKKYTIKNYEKIDTQSNKSGLEYIFFSLFGARKFSQTDNCVYYYTECLVFCQFFWLISPRDRQKIIIPLDS